jgi:hypothetical protein
VTQDPDFNELIGDEGSPEELDRLRKVHDMLLAVGPPPELSPAHEHAPEVPEDSKVVEFRRRKPVAVFAIAAAIAVAAFAIGYAVAGRNAAFHSSISVPMHGLGVQRAAVGDVQVGNHDSGGNYPLQMSVTGLRHLPKGGWYELLLSEHGKPTLACGAFVIDGGETTFRLSVPYDLDKLHKAKKYDGWVVVRHLPGSTSTPIVMST